jgi:hypothetical protein
MMVLVFPAQDMKLTCMLIEYKTSFCVYIITNIQSNTMNITTHLLRNRKLHVSVSVDHHQAKYKEFYYN